VTTDQIVLLVICGVLAISAALTGILVHRQSGHKPHLFAGIGWALVAISLWVSGLATLIWQAIQAIIAWAVGLATNIVGGVGLAALAVGALVVIFSRVSTRRTKAKVNARRPPTPPPAPTATATSSATASSAGPASSGRPSMARRLGRMARTIREGASGPSETSTASSATPRASAKPSTAAPAPLPPSQPSRPLLNLGDEWNTLDLDTPAAQPAPTAAGAPLPTTPSSASPPVQERRGPSADDEVQQIQSALRPPGQ